MSHRTSLHPRLEFFAEVKVKSTKGGRVSLTLEGEGWWTDTTKVGLLMHMHSLSLVVMSMISMLSDLAMRNGGPGLSCISTFFPPLRLALDETDDHSPHQRWMLNGHWICCPLHFWISDRKRWTTGWCFSAVWEMRVHAFKTLDCQTRGNYIYIIVVPGYAEIIPSQVSL